MADALHGAHPLHLHLNLFTGSQNFTRLYFANRHYKQTILVVNELRKSLHNRQKQLYCAFVATGFSNDVTMAL